MRACAEILPAEQLWQAEGWLRETREALLLETQLATGLAFGGVRDIRGAVHRAKVGGLLEGEELLDIASTLAAARKMRRTLEEREAHEIPTLLESARLMRTCPELEQRINFCLDDTGVVTDRASPALAEARAQQKRLRDRVQRSLQNFLQKHPVYFQEQLITERGGRFVLLVKVNYKEHVPGIVHDASGSGQTLYIEPLSVVEDQNRLRQWQRTEAEEIERVLWELSGLVAGEFAALDPLIAILTLLDCATARARYSQWTGGVEPRFDPECIELRSLCHPLLVAQTQHDPSRTVVPIHLELTPPLRCVVITGPNTGGKTLTLKAVGLAVLMAKAGLFIPATKAVLPWCEQVLADIGDEQSLEQSLSTFSSHIRRIVGILQAVTPTDLVLLDEVGAGTDPQEGAALAAALLQYLAGVSRFTMATTHYGELKALKYSDPRFENASVEFDEVSLAPTYRLLWGIPGRSNALNIARRLGLQPSILEQAQTWLSPESQQVNTVIAELEAQRKRQDTAAQQAQDLSTQVEKLHRDLSAQKEALIRERLALQQQQQQQIQLALTEARAQVAQVIRQLQASPTAQQAQRATEALAGLQPNPQGPQREEDLRYHPKVGDRVEILALGQKGEILSVDDNDQAVVRCGILKLTAPADQLWPLGVQKPPKPAPAPLPKPAPKPAVRTTQNTIDIRGQRVADLDTLLGDRLGHYHGPVWIIHGNGTGRLRDGVHEYLKNYPHAQHFDLAEPSDGGTGATVVYLG